MLVPLCCSGFPNCQHSLLKKDMTTDPQPSCSEIARDIASALFMDRGHHAQADNIRIITEALQAKQKEIEEKDALIIKGMKLANQEIAEKQATIESLRAEVERLSLLLDSPATCICDTPAVYGLKSWICQQHGVITTRKPSYEVLNKFYEASQSELSRLKEILKGRDEALEKIANLEWPHLGVVDIAQQALSKTWEEGER